jgi:hypothetical protein
MGRGFDFVLSACGVRRWASGLLKALNPGAAALRFVGLFGGQRCVKSPQMDASKNYALKCETLGITEFVILNNEYITNLYYVIYT